MGMVFSKEKDGRRRIEGPSLPAGPHSLWESKTAAAGSAASALFYICEFALKSLLFIAPLNKLLNRVLWVLTSDSHIGSTLRDYRPSSSSVVTVAESKIYKRAKVECNMSIYNPSYQDAKAGGSQI